LVEQLEGKVEFLTQKIDTMKKTNLSINQLLLQRQQIAELTLILDTLNNGGKIKNMAAVNNCENEAALNNSNKIKGLEPAETDEELSDVDRAIKRMEDQVIEEAQSVLKEVKTELTNDISEIEEAADEIEKGYDSTYTEIESMRNETPDFTNKNIPIEDMNFQFENDIDICEAEKDLIENKNVFDKVDALEKELTKIEFEENDEFEKIDIIDNSAKPNGETEKIDIYDNMSNNFHSDEVKKNDVTENSDNFDNSNASFFEETDNVENFIDELDKELDNFDKLSEDSMALGISKENLESDISSGLLNDEVDDILSDIEIDDKVINDELEMIELDNFNLTSEKIVISEQESIAFENDINFNDNVEKIDITALALEAKNFEDTGELVKALNTYEKLLNETIRQGMYALHEKIETKIQELKNKL